MFCIAITATLLAIFVFFVSVLFLGETTMQSNIIFKFKLSDFLHVSQRTSFFCRFGLFLDQLANICAVNVCSRGLEIK